MSGNAVLGRRSNHSDTATYYSAPLFRPPNIALGHLDHSNRTTLWSAPSIHPPFNAVVEREHIHAARRQIRLRTRGVEKERARVENWIASVRK